METMTGRDSLRDIIVEAVNAKDPDLFSLADDIEISDVTVDVILEVMERWPQLLVSRGELGVEPVAAVWLPDEEERYAQVGYLEFYIEDGAARIELVEEVPSELVAESPPAMELAEWETAAAVGEGWVV